MGNKTTKSALVHLLMQPRTFVRIFLFDNNLEMNFFDFPLGALDDADEEGVVHDVELSKQEGVIVDPDRTILNEAPGTGRCL